MAKQHFRRLSLALKDNLCYDNEYLKNTINIYSLPFPEISYDYHKLPWCIHNGKNTNANDCPYTLKHGLKCSMPHKDQPNGSEESFLNDSVTSEDRSPKFFKNINLKKHEVALENSGNICKECFGSGWIRNNKSGLDFGLSLKFETCKKCNGTGFI